ncbi:hypothetical protein V8J88_10595 [Massilia sp. W12]|uniref:hypothetical protein n=1 Tax=Massilia sp. W12 TaxID=3126507 RepID=UPI0030CFB1DC
MLQFGVAQLAKAVLHNHADVWLCMFYGLRSLNAAVICQAIPFCFIAKKTGRAGGDTGAVIGIAMRAIVHRRNGGGAHAACKQKQGNFTFHHDSHPKNTFEKSHTLSRKRPAWYVTSSWHACCNSWRMPGQACFTRAMLQGC